MYYVPIVTSTTIGTCSGLLPASTKITTVVRTEIKADVVGMCIGR